MEQNLNYVFDLYGTLIDLYSDEKAPKTWKKWLKYLDQKNIKHPDYITFRADFFNLDKRNRILLKERTGCDVPEIDIIEVYDELFQRYGNPPMDEEKLNEIAYEFRRASIKRIRLFPGVTQYLKKLKSEGKNVYILSNAQRSYTWPEIKMFGFDYLTDDQLISSDFGVMKPDVSFFNALIEKYSLDRTKTIMHGDSYSSDVCGAISAGINYIHLAGENSPEEYYVNQIK